VLMNSASWATSIRTPVIAWGTPGSAALSCAAACESGCNEPEVGADRPRVTQRQENRAGTSAIAAPAQPHRPTGHKQQAQSHRHQRRTRTSRIPTRSVLTGRRPSAQLIAPYRALRACQRLPMTSRSAPRPVTVPLAELSIVSSSWRRVFSVDWSAAATRS
jgi:hypothetical protein